MSRRSGAHQARALECGALVVVVAPTEWRAISAEVDPVTFASGVLPVIVSDILPAAR
jgi:hypothetical protein